MILWENTAVSRPLFVEVLSSSTKSKDMSTKLELYIKCFVCYYLIVYSEEKGIYIYTFRNREILKYSPYCFGKSARSSLYEGLEVCLEDIFK